MDVKAKGAESQEQTGVLFFRNTLGAGAYPNIVMEFQIRRVARARDTHLFMVLHLAFYIILATYSLAK